MSDNLTFDILQDTIQTVINATSVWYGTSDTVERGKILASLESAPPFVIIHPDDVSLLPASARHLREYRPTQADMAKEAQIAFRDEEAEKTKWVMRLYPRWGRGVDE